MKLSESIRVMDNQTTPLLRALTDSSFTDINAMHDKDSSKGRLRAYWLGSVVCMGGFLFGYDSGM